MADAPVRPFDIVVFGATSFVGQILCAHLVERHGTNGPLRWAVAGRNAEKLDEVVKATGADVEQVVADATNPAAMRSLAESARVVVSTVGPYALYGSELVAAAAAAGTDYCDLTGEPQWMQRMIDAHQGEAEASGARIVHTCGFDSIPSDLGVAYTQAQAHERFGEPCSSIAMRVKAMKGGASGGTAASGLNMLDEVAADPSLKAVLANPFALAPKSMRQGPPQPEVTKPARDRATGQWAAPFVMATINTKVVHRSHALAGRPWGDDFTYDEAMLMGGGPLGAAKAAALSGGLAAVTVASAASPVRKMMRRVAPSPGEGPSPEEQAAGFFDIRFFGTTRDGRTITTKVTGDADPGYGSTAKMLGEAALAVSELGDDVAGGFHTPASALGVDLVDPLTRHAGLTFDVI